MSNKNTSSHVSIVGGGGHIGLPLSCYIQNKGYQVLIVDNNIESINSIRKGKAPFFEEGLDKMVIDSGLNFSGGQIQRIGIARALYNSPEILVFDEPTSAIDSKLKESFLNDIYAISKTKTIIMVTHNKLDLKKCNKVIELDKYE